LVNNLASKYIELMSETGQYIRPTLGMLHDFKYLEDVPYDKEFQFMTSFDIRSWFKFQQHVKHLDPSLVFNVDNDVSIHHILYNIIKGVCPNNIIVTPRILNTVLTYNFEKIMKFSELCLDYGLYPSCPECPIMQVILDYFGYDNLDNEIYISHESKIAIAIKDLHMSYHVFEQVTYKACSLLLKQLSESQIDIILIANCRTIEDIFDIL
jgi:hypothetical protein